MLKLKIEKSRHKVLSFGSTIQLLSVLPKFRAGTLSQNLNFCSIKISHRGTSLLYPPALTFSMVSMLTKIGHFWTTYLPRLVNIVCECPLTLQLTVGKSDIKVNQTSIMTMMLQKSNKNPPLVWLLSAWL